MLVLIQFGRFSITVFVTIFNAPFLCLLRLLNAWYCRADGEAVATPWVCGVSPRGLDDAQLLDHQHVCGGAASLQALCSFLNWLFVFASKSTFRGTWVVQSIELPTLGSRSGQDRALH